MALINLENVPFGLDEPRKIETGMTPLLSAPLRVIRG
jgi:hypothetical protein